MEHDPQKLNYYQRLGISESATTEEVVAAYRALRKQFHPDDKPAAYRDYFDQAMKGINEARDVLREPAKRRRYDARLRSLQSQQREKHSGARPPRGSKGASDERRGGRRQSRGRLGQPRSRHVEKKRGARLTSSTRDGRSSGSGGRREERRGGARKGVRRRGALPAAFPTENFTSRY